MTDLRDQLIEAVRPLNEGPYPDDEFADALEPIVWAFAAQELRRAADDGARLCVGIPRTWGWLRERAGVMDGGERR